MSKVIIGVMGGGDKASNQAVQTAFRLGELIAEKGWVLLNGGRNAGVMDASAVGARSKGGFVIGILPGKDKIGSSEHLDIAIVTGMGDARNVINVLSCDVVIACEGGEGTISEIALALKNSKPVVSVNFSAAAIFHEITNSELFYEASTPEEAVEIAQKFIDSQG